MEANKQEAINAIYKHMKAIRKIARDYCSEDDRYLSLLIGRKGRISFNNTYWELPEDKQIEFWEVEE